MDIERGHSDRLFNNLSIHFLRDSPAFLNRHSSKVLPWISQRMSVAHALIRQK